MVWATVVTQTIMLGIIKPFNLPHNNLMEIANETLIILILYTMMCFSDWVPDIQTRTYVGYASCAMVVSHLLANLALMILNSIRLAIFNYRKWMN